MVEGETGAEEAVDAGSPGWVRRGSNSWITHAQVANLLATVVKQEDEFHFLEGGLATVKPFHTPRYVPHGPDWRMREHHVSGAYMASAYTRPLCLKSGGPRDSPDS